MFLYSNNGKWKTKVAFVSTYKTAEAQYIVDANTTYITVSVKTASLLAIIVLNKLNTISMNQTPSVILFSPIAGSVFSKDDVDTIAKHVGSTPLTVVQRINVSCQSGGHYLEDSRMHVAAVATIVSTRGVKDKKMKDSIIGKTLKQYWNGKKVWYPNYFEAYAEFGHGGVPSNISPDNLIKKFEGIQKVTPIQAAIAAKATKSSHS